MLSFLNSYIIQLFLDTDLHRRKRPKCVLGLELCFFDNMSKNLSITMRDKINQRWSKCRSEIAKIQVKNTCFLGEKVFQSDVKLIGI